MSWAAPEASAGAEAQQRRAPQQPLRAALRRAAVVAVPLALFVASLPVLAAAVPAWGAGREQGLPAWMPTASAVLFALPGLVAGGLCARETLRRTRYGFSLHLFQLSAGFIFMLMTTAAEAALALRVADPATYERLERPDGTEVTPEGFFAMNVMVVIIFAAIVFFTSYLYSQGITPDVPTRHDRRAGERDAIAEILKGP